ncbi:MAG: type IV pilus assembly protein PilM [Deltaproteobacteria bacterium]|nr:type IV pilus assembly protein PilM [Deltaproteobacteria bacterium]
MDFKALLRRSESLISIDIGSSAVKMLELDTSGDRPKLLNIGIAPIVGEIFSNNTITKGEKIAEQITALLEANSVGDKRVCTAIPGPSVFTKKIKMAKMDPAELASNVQFEAGNFIPHNIEAVHLDYHVIGEAGKNQLDVLVVAVKNEILDSFLECFSYAGLEVAVADVDCFAVQNMFELGYPELTSKTVALVNIGARYASINICKNGQSLFTGDVPVGGKLFTDAIIEVMGVPADQAEALKRKKKTAGSSTAQNDAIAGAVQDILDRNIEYVASELNRQLSFFWNASGAEEQIDSIMLTGGGSLMAGLADELSEKTGISCSILDPLRGIEKGDGFDAAYLQEIAPLMSVAVGMGIRQPGDKITPEYDED